MNKLNPKLLSVIFYSFLMSSVFSFSLLANTVDTSPVSKKMTLSVTISSGMWNGADVSCNGASDGLALAEAIGGTMPYTYLWDDATTNATASGLSIGVPYTVTVTDMTTATATATITLTVEPTAVTSTTSGMDVSCTGGSDGEATATGSDGTGPYTYLWSDAQATATATSLVAGTYTVTVSDANGCNTTDAVTIGEPMVLLSLSIDATVDLLCNDDDIGSITASAAGGMGAYTFDDGTTTNNDGMFTGLGAGTHTITVTDDSGCMMSMPVVITEPAALMAGTSVTDVLCNGDANGTATAMVSGGTLTYTYEWSDGQTDPTAIGLAVATYEVTVTDMNGCTATATAIIGEPDVLEIGTVISADVTCFGAADGSGLLLGFNIQGGTPTYDIDWSNGDSGSSAPGLIPGTYTVTVTDANGCTETTAAFEIEEPTEITFSTEKTDITCSGAMDGTASVINPMGGEGSYTYEWTDGQTTQVATGLAAGTYDVTVTDGDGCEVTASETIIDPDLLMASAVVDMDVSCLGGSNGRATATGVGGTTDYTYEWSDGQTTETAISLPAGTYNVTITDLNGCTASSSPMITITQPATVLTATASETASVTCFAAADGAIMVVAVDGTPFGVAPFYTYEWSEGSTTAAVSSLPGGTYTVTVTDAAGCQTTASVMVEEPTELVAMVDSIDVTCFAAADGEVTVTPTGGTVAVDYTYLWDDGGASTSATLTGLSGGTYTVTVTDDNTCQTTASVTVNEPDVLDLTTTPASGTDVNCNGEMDGSVTVTPTGGTMPYTYDWTDSGAATVGTTATVTGLAAGTYDVIVTDANSCDDITSVTITEPAVALSAIASVTSTYSGEDISCNGEEDGAIIVVAMNGTSPYTYLWDDVMTQTTAAVSGLAAGDYNVTVTDFNLCTVTASVTVNEPVLLEASAVVTSDFNGVNVSCFGAMDGEAEVIYIGGTSPHTYAWDDMANQTTATATGLAAGTYEVIVTDGNGCTSSASVTLTEPFELSAVASATSMYNGADISCFGASDGAVTAIGIGGTSPYTYLWSGGETTGTVTGLAADTYDVTVTDANSCTATGSATLTDPDVLDLTTTPASGTDVNCNGGMDGTVTVTPADGTPPYTYLWDDMANQTTATATGLLAGTYNVTVTDDNGCNDMTSVTIGEPAVPLSAVASVTSIYNGADITCFGEEDGAIMVVAMGGTIAVDYTYEWSELSNTAAVSGLGAGDYDVTVTDDNGCTVTASVTINEPDELILTDDSTPTSCNGGSDGIASVMVAGGTMAYSYIWDAAAGGATTLSVSGLAAGDYEITVTDINICRASIIVTVTDSDELSVNVAGTHISCNGGAEGTASAIPTGGTPTIGAVPYTYLWDDALTQTDSTATGLAAGIYNVIVTDDNGCMTTASFTVIEPAALMAVGVGTDPSCDGMDDGQVTATITGGVTTYNFLWDDPAGQTTTTATGLLAGTYNVTVTDDNGCTLTETVTITDPGIECSICAPDYEGVNMLTGILSVMEDYETDGGIDSDQVINNNTKVDYDATIDIDLLPGFEVQLGVEFDAFIDGCNDGAGGNQ